MPRLLILKGPPATGKTTFRATLVEQGWKYTNLDELREAYPDYSEGDIHELQRSMLFTYMAFGENIIIDNLNLNPKTTNRYETYAVQFRYDVEYKLFGADLRWQGAMIRDHIRGLNGGRTVGKSVIIRSYMDAGLWKEPKRDAVIFDIDGTLADNTHRLHFLTDEEKKDWKSFHAHLHLDTVHTHVAILYDALLNAEMEIILVSGRGEEYRKETEEWLRIHDFRDHFALFMRPFNNRNEDSLIKADIYERYIKPHFNVHFVVDDRPRVLRMWREKGLRTFDVGNGIEF